MMMTLDTIIYTMITSVIIVVAVRVDFIVLLLTTTTTIAIHDSCNLSPIIYCSLFSAYSSSC